VDFLLSAGELKARSGAKWRMHPPDVMPAFVAEMDFKVAPAIQDAIRELVEQQDYGYGQLTDPSQLFETFASWMQLRHGWQPDPAPTMALSDVVQGLVATISAFSERGDGVISQTPAYPPFLKSIEWTGRRLIDNPMADDGKRFVIDLGGLERAAADASMIFVCNPQNPTGRVLERAELEGIATIAAAHDLIIVADEIHADLVYPGAKHVPMETVASAASRTVTLTSATKGFNIPGLRTAIAHFGTPELKMRFDARFPEHLLGGPSRIGIAATIAAWRQGQGWLDEVMAYLDINRRRLAQWAGAHGLGHHMPEATYLAWLDCRGLALEEGVSPQQHFLDRARVALSHGADFGEAGVGHVRLNFATSVETLDEILGRLGDALK
jgi:cysteine-S-conjugate beta-lyase